MGCFLDDLRAFGINADWWTTAAQDEREWRRTAERGKERFVAKWIAAEKARAGLRYAVVCPNVTGRSKERIAQSKRTRAGSLATNDQSQVARFCILQAFGMQMTCRLPLTLRLFFMFRVRLFAFTEAAALRSIVLHYACAPTATCSNLTTFRVLFCSCFFLFLFLWRCRFFRELCTTTIYSLYGVGRTFFPCGCFSTF